MKTASKIACRDMFLFACYNERGYADDRVRICLRNAVKKRLSEICSVSQVGPS